MTQKKKILFICMENSIHAAKWINSLAENELYELYIFPISVEIQHQELSKDVNVLHHPLIRMINKTDIRVRNFKFKLIRYPSIWFMSNIRFIVDKLQFVIDKSGVRMHHFNGPKRLERVINSLQPDLVHALEIQHSGYLYNSMRKRAAGNKLSSKFAISNWGSDIEFYKNNYRHVELISEVISNADYLFVECDRDAKYATDIFGYQGTIFKSINSVGIDFRSLPKINEWINNSDRRIILVKGYQSVFGRASLAYKALEDCAEELGKRNYKVLSYSTTLDSIKIVKEINKRGLISIEILPRMSNYDLLDIFCKSQVYIGIGVSDGISISSLEAMATGAIPIQTNTSCCNEWYVDEFGGFIVPPSVEAIKKSILKIIEGNFNGNLAAISNYNKVICDANYLVNAQKVQNYYSEIFNKN